MLMFRIGNQCKLLCFLFALLLMSGIAWADSASKNKQFTTDFNSAACTFSAEGGNAYFSLNSGDYPILLEGEEDKELVQVQIDLGETDTIDLENLGLSDAQVRIIYETEWIDGELIEESTNYYARCAETNAIFYFGEDVIIYEYDDEGNVTTIMGAEAGSWLAGELSEDGETYNQPGVIMPGTFLLGSRYYQEIAPGIALDRAENIEMGLTVETPAGIYENCVKMEETTPLEPSAKDVKIYAPGVGIIVDNAIERVNAFQ